MVCERCGYRKVFDLRCKVLCPNCGSIVRDCSDNFVEIDNFPDNINYHELRKEGKSDKG